MDRVLYGIRTAEACWHEHLFHVLKKMGLTTSMADLDVLMRPAEDISCYEYNAVYVMS